MFANHSEFKHLQSDEALIQIGSFFSHLKISSSNVDTACSEITEHVKKMFDTQGVLLFVFAPVGTKFENEKLIKEVKGPYTNDYFLITMNQGFTIDDFKSYFSDTPQVIQLDERAYTHFSSLPLHKPPLILLKIWSKHFVRQEKDKALRDLLKICDENFKDVKYCGGPFYDYNDNFVLISTHEDSNDYQNLITNLIYLKFDRTRISQETFEKLLKHPLLPKFD